MWHFIIFHAKGIPILMRIGSEDKTVHPYYSRRMLRLLKENDIDVLYEEIPGIYDLFQA